MDSHGYVHLDADLERNILPEAQACVWLISHLTGDAVDDDDFMQVCSSSQQVISVFCTQQVISILCTEVVASHPLQAVLRTD